MAKFMRNRPVQRRVETITSDNVLDVLCSEFNLNKEKISSILRSVGIALDGSNRVSEMPLYREVITCKIGDCSRYTHADEAYLLLLDEQLRSFDEIYVDTAPIIQEDWFLYFVCDAEPILKRRKKKLIVLEKTLEELHGLKDNLEKDKEVRIRSTIRPDMLRLLARKGIVRIGDTGSRGIADDHLVTLFEQVGQNKNLLLVTQDRGLSERIVRLAQKLEQEVVAHRRPRPWYKKLFSRGNGTADELLSHRMVACKLVDGGKLKRCYICPECDESYYDDLHACEGMVLCGSCYLKLKEQEARQVAQNKLKREAELKMEEERQRKLEEEEQRLEQERSRDTVENRVRQLQKKVLRILLVASASVLLLIILLLIMF
jgi:ferredoxin